MKKKTWNKPWMASINFKQPEERKMLKVEKELTARFLTACCSSDKNTVYVVFVDSFQRQFVIEWNRLDDDHFDLSLNVMSETYELNELIRNAISSGETNDNKNLSLYLDIRDKFDANDCKVICGD